MSQIALDKAGGWAALSAYERSHGGPGEALTAWYLSKMNAGRGGHGLKGAADLASATWKEGFQ